MIWVAAAFAASAVVASDVASSDATSSFFHELLSRQALRGEAACGLSPKVGGDQRLVFARGVSCKGKRHAHGSSALGIVTARLSSPRVPGWTCTSFDARDAELLCYHGRDRTARIRKLGAAFGDTHIRAVMP